MEEFRSHKVTNTKAAIHHSPAYCTYSDDEFRVCLAKLDNSSLELKMCRGQKKKNMEQEERGDEAGG